MSMKTIGIPHEANTETRRCSRCGTLFRGADVIAAMFGRLGDRVHAITRRALMRKICLCCIRTAADEKKRANRWRNKAHDTRKNHAKKLDTSPHKLEHTYGWTIERIVDAMSTAYLGHCSGPCGEPYAEMGHGFADITLDITNPESPPYWETNVRPMCSTCNRSKGQLSPQEYNARLRGWEQWKTNRSHEHPEGSLFRVWDET